MYDELIKRLRRCASYDPRFVIQDCKDAADAIEELQKQRDEWESHAALAESFAQGWIPVTERLPNCNGCYLVWRPHFFGGEIGMPSICYFDGSNTWHDSYGVDFERILHPEEVTHWMPLPEPPKEDEE